MKKLLSIILVLAMLLGMTALPVFAGTYANTITLSDTNKVLVGKTISLKKSTSPAALEVTWTSGTPAVATVSAGVVTGVTEGTSVITAAASNAETKTKTVTVYDGSKYKYLNTDESYNLQKGEPFTLDPKLAYDGSHTDGLSVVTTKFSSSDSTVASVNEITGKIEAKATGSARITAKTTLGAEKVLDDYSCLITVYDLSISYEVENYDDISISQETLFEDIESAIYSNERNSVDVVSVSVSYKENPYGTLKTSDTIITTSKPVSDDGLDFTAEKGAVGEALYEFTAVTKEDGNYTGTLVFDIQEYDTIDEIISAPFSSNPFYISVPSELDYMKVVSSETGFDGLHRVSGSEKWYKYNEDFEFKPNDYSPVDGKVTLYVVGLDDDGYVYTGTIEVENLDYDIRYIGAVDEETELIKKDFTDLYEAIFEEKNVSTKAYVELESVTFTYSTNKNYKLYNDSKEMTASTLKKVDVDDLGDVTIEPLKSGEHYIKVTLNGKYYTSSDAKSGTSLPYSAIILVSAVSGDVQYSVVNGSTVAFDEMDFQYYVEDQLTSKALLNYVVFDDSDLNATKEGTLKVLDGYRYYAVDEDEKFYYDADRNQYEVSDLRFAPSSLAANGTKVYIPFKAYGSKTGSENGKTLLTDGYVEITIINNPFTDLTASWYKDAVLWAYGHTPQITKGTNLAGTLFSPDQACTRAQAVTFLYRAAGAPTVSASEKSAVLATFKDVNATKHKDFVDAIAWAKAKGITSGTSATTFGPDKTCTRAQIVTFIYNYAKSAGKSVATQFTNGFTDVKPTTTHKSYANAIQWAVEQEITNGINTAGTLFGPDQTCTRGHIVTFLYNYFN